MIQVAPSYRPSSSTRMEGIAGLVAMHTPGRIEIVSDSRAMVMRHEAVSRYKRLQAPRYWANRPDGDLWCRWCESLRLKGISCVSVRWTPGHARERSTGQHLFADADADGNQRADVAACSASAGRESAANGVLPMLASRWGKYKAFVHELMQMQLDIIKHAMAIRADAVHVNDRLRASAEASVLVSYPWR